MSEFSWYYTTPAGGAAGDQQLAASGYTQSLEAQANAILAHCFWFEGVAPGYLNSLVCAANGANTVSVNTGGALVDGHIYSNGASVNVNIPSAVGGGNTRIDVLVLRCSWAGFTVRITRVAGTDAAVPTPPAITQTPGTTYDIELCQVLVNTAGAVTVTDMRTYAQLGNVHAIKDGLLTTTQLNAAAGIVGTQLANGTLTTTQLNAAAGITDAQLVNGKVSNRQGGDASDWSVTGTSNYAPSAVKIQSGSISATLTGVSFVDVTVNFPVAFSNKPLVIISLASGAAAKLKVGSYNPAGGSFQAHFQTVDGTNDTETVTANWIAIGPS